MRNRYLKLFFTFSIASVFLVGCATPPSSVPLAAEKRNSIKNVYLDKNVAKPKELYWRGTAQAWGAAFGALGAGLTANAGASDAEHMVKFMGEKNIDISEIVYSEASVQLATVRTFNISDPSKSDATLVFAVDRYGFNKTHPFGSNMNPLIRLTGKLVRPNNEVVWQQSEFVSDFASENDQGQSVEIYQNEPEKLRAALTKASKVAVARILTTLQ